LPSPSECLFVRKLIGGQTTPRHASERLCEPIAVLTRSLNLKACSTWSRQARYKLEVARREQVRTMANALPTFRARHSRREIPRIYSAPSNHQPMAKTVEEGERGQMQEG
jgi:hypothetical protein